MKVQKYILNCTVVAGSILAGLLLCEGGLRLFLHPADYLGVQMVSDPVLGAVPSSHTRAGGFDSWGFRNSNVPDGVDIVAIGDSHTYGNTATMVDSWPYALGRLSRLKVYNMALGGYGPNQYFALLPRALKLKPRLIICGLYMGDDFENAFLITYGLDHWAYLRELPDKNVDPNIWPVESRAGSLKAARVWLSWHSVAYQLLFHGPLMGLIQGEYQIRHAAELYSGSATMVSVPDKNILEAFLPVGILHRINQDSPAVREGMRITFRLLNEMNETSRHSGADFLVVVIPTKESVFSEYIEHKSTLPLSDVLDQVIANERVARRKLFEFFDNSSIPYVDALPALQRSVEHQLYARTAADIHPNRNGYRVVAESIAEALKRKEKGSASSRQPETGASTSAGKSLGR